MGQLIRTLGCREGVTDAQFGPSYALNVERMKEGGGGSMPTHDPSLSRMSDNRLFAAGFREISVVLLNQFVYI